MSVTINLENRENFILFEGPLHGKVLPSESMWAILPENSRSISSNIDEDEERSQSSEEYKGMRILLSLEKSFSDRDIWTTALNRDFMLSLQEINNEYQ